MATPKTRVTVFACSRYLSTTANVSNQNIHFIKVTLIFKHIAWTQIYFAVTNIRTDNWSSHSSETAPKCSHLWGHIQTCLSEMHIVVRWVSKKRSVLSIRDKLIYLAANRDSSKGELDECLLHNSLALNTVKSKAIWMFETAERRHFKGLYQF